MITLVVPLLAGSVGAGPAGHPVAPAPDATIFIATGSFGAGGTLVSMQRQTPWDAVTVAALDSQSPVVQTFSGVIYVVEPDTDRVRVFDGAGTEIRWFPVGEGTSPRDILGVARNRAYVTRAGSTHLYRVDPQTGVGADVVDLSGLADGIPDMERMATDGTRLFIQLRRLPGGAPGPGADCTVGISDFLLLLANWGP